MKRIFPASRLMVMGVLALALTSSAATDIFELPALQDRFLSLKRDLIVAMQFKNYEAMEEVCRAGRALLPEDPTFAYNLACALALRCQREGALRALREAVVLGFRDVGHIRGDSDLASLRDHPAFEAVLKQAAKPEPKGQRWNTAVALPIQLGKSASVSTTNTVWDFDNSIFRTFFTVETTGDTQNAATIYNGPARHLLAPWLADGTAAGNGGDLYENRDDGHSRLNCADFPGLTPVVFGAEVLRASTRPNYGTALFLYNRPTLCNSSTALTKGPFWRSQARMLLVSPARVGGLLNQYLNNHIYFYPAHNDFGESHGDVFPFNAPYFIISRGSSHSDMPFIRAVAATLAALRPATKEYLMSKGLLASTVQMILRSTQLTLKTPDDYFSGLAHPVVFNATNLNVEAMVKVAHDLTTNNIPPLVVLTAMHEPQWVNGRDFFDTFATATPFNSPALLPRVYRGLDWEYDMIVRANVVVPPGASRPKLRWVLLQGDPNLVELLPMNKAADTARIRVAYHKPGFASVVDPKITTARVDIGCFAECEGTYPSAPAIISFHFLANEIREYDEHHRIRSVTYGADRQAYNDPMLTCRREWRDVYSYDAQGRCTGWVRHRGDQQDSFTPHGLLIETRDKKGRAQTARAVRYIPRTSSAPLPDLIQAADDVLFNYTYIDDDDLIGQPIKK